MRFLSFNRSHIFLSFNFWVNCPHFLNTWWHQCIWSPPKGFFFSRGFGRKHHLQQDPRPGPPTARHLPEPPRCHHHHWGGCSAGHQRVPVSVSLRTVELLCPWREDRLWERAESRSVGAARWAVLLCVRVALAVIYLAGIQVWPCETREDNKRLKWTQSVHNYLKKKSFKEKFAQLQTHTNGTSDFVRTPARRAHSNRVF